MRCRPSRRLVTTGVLVAVSNRVPLSSNEQELLHYV